MEEKQLPNTSDLAREYLVESLRQLGRDNDKGCSKHLWLAARQASLVAAQWHGWMADTDEAIDVAIRKIDHQHGEQAGILSQFHTAEMFRDNAEYGFLERDDILGFQPLVHRFVNRMLTLSPPGRGAGC